MSMHLKLKSIRSTYCIRIWINISFSLTPDMDLYNWFKILIADLNTINQKCLNFKNEHYVQILIKILLNLILSMDLQNFTPHIFAFCPYLWVDQSLKQ